MPRMIGHGRRKRAASTKDSSCVLSPISASATKAVDTRKASTGLSRLRSRLRHARTGKCVYAVTTDIIGGGTVRMPLRLIRDNPEAPMKQSDQSVLSHIEKLVAEEHHLFDK